MNAPAPIHRIPKLMASDQDIAWLVHYARTASEAQHPAYGNFLCDVLDALIAVHSVYDGDAEEELAAAEALVDAATALRDYADRKVMNEVLI